MSYYPFTYAQPHYPATDLPVHPQPVDEENEENEDPELQEQIDSYFVWHKLPLWQRYYLAAMGYMNRNAVRCCHCAKEFYWRQTSSITHHFEQECQDVRDYPLLNTDLTTLQTHRKRTTYKRFCTFTNRELPSNNDIEFLIAHDFYAVNILQCAHPGCSWARKWEDVKSLINLKNRGHGRIHCYRVFTG